MERIKLIQPYNNDFYIAAKRRWDAIAKPLGSFGELEKIVQQIAAIQETDLPDISSRTAVIFCADHGIIEEGVTQCGSNVTSICAKAIADGKSNINALAANSNTNVIAIDIGMKNNCNSPYIRQYKVNFGTKNFKKEPAMTIEETIQAITIGINIVQELHQNNVKLIVSGEMGIGNTTSASAISSVLLQLPPEEVTGRGAGLSNKGLETKISVIKEAIRLHQPSPDRPLHLLQTLGGFEIAGMVGLYLGGGIFKIPVIIDGVISAAAAVIASKINSNCTLYMIASHCSEEPAGKGLLSLLNKKAIIQAGLRLGEGTGAMLMIPLLDQALSLYYHAHQFDDEGIERYVEQK